MNGSSRASAVAVKLVALATLAHVAFGCSTIPRTVDVAKLGPVQRVEVYKGGEHSIVRPIAAGSAQERAVTAWLQSHSNGWRLDINTYVPGKRVIGENYNLNFAGRSCVLNYGASEKGPWVQVSRSLRDGDNIPDVFGTQR